MIWSETANELRQVRERNQQQYQNRWQMKALKLPCGRILRDVFPEIWSDDWSVWSAGLIDENSFSRQPEGFVLFLRGWDGEVWCVMKRLFFLLQHQQSDSITHVERGVWRVKESNCRTTSQRYKHVFLSPPSPAADLLVNTLCLPFTLVYTLQGEWKFGSTLCFMLPYAQGLAVHVSTVTLNVIALDRHRWVGLKDGGVGGGGCSSSSSSSIFFSVVFFFFITKVVEMCLI